MADIGSNLVVAGSRGMAGIMKILGLYPRFRPLAGRRRALLDTDPSLLRVPTVLAKAGAPATDTADDAPTGLGDYCWDTENDHVYLCTAYSSSTTFTWLKVDITSLVAEALLYLSFNDASGSVASDETENGHDGTLSSGAKWTQGLNPARGAVEFHSTSSAVVLGDYVDVADSVASLNVSDQPFSVCAWFCWAGSSLDRGGFLVIRGSVGATGKRFNLHVVEAARNSSGTTADDVKFTIDDDGAGGKVDVWAFTNLERNKWYHVVGVRDTTELRIYLNGTLRTSEDITGYGDIDDPSVGMQIGSSPVANYDSFFGKIAEVMMFDRALDATEIMTIYQYGRTLELLGKNAFDEKRLVPGSNE